VKLPELRAPGPNEEVVRMRTEITFVIEYDFMTGKGADPIERMNNVTGETMQANMERAMMIESSVTCNLPEGAVLVKRRGKNSAPDA
jgi:hypothetical protein